METTKCREKRSMSNIYIYRREGAATHEGCGQPLPFSPLHGGGNPLLHRKVTPLIK
jgi:hypothetical protein